jgi:Protein of unknown function (DUF3179)
MGQTGTRKAVLIAALCALIPIVCLAIPMYVIRPFVPQNARALALALEVRRFAPMVSAICLLAAIAATVWGWGRSRLGTRIALCALLIVTCAGAWAARINIFEKMFHPYDSPAFASASDVPVDADDMVLSVKLGGEAHAYPIRTMGYHHVVNDTLGNVPIAVTYCTLCHTGLVWKREIDGRTLYFRLAGIDNGNALVRDEQTGTIWQQSTGEAIFGPLKGRHLDVVHSDELTFALWRSEQPHGLVLTPDPAYIADYDPKDWEKHIAKTHAVVDTSASGIDPHRLMVGVTVAGQSKAYPMDVILRAKVVDDTLAGVPILLLAGQDGASVRVFEARGAMGSAMTFVRNGAVVRDAESASIWDFQGCSVEGTMAGRCLKALDSHKDYWFDWMNHYPGTAVFRD